MKRVLPLLAIVAVLALLYPRPAPRSGPVIPSATLGAASTDQAQSGESAETLAPYSGGASGATERPNPSLAGGGAPHPSGGIGQPASYCRQFCDTPEPKVVVSKGSVAGTSTWYSYVYGGAAAAQKLRDYLGPDWRGTTVEVCFRGNCVRAILLDYESSTIPGRLIDLDSRLFAQLAPLSVGVITVEVREVAP